TTADAPAHLFAHRSALPPDLLAFPPRRSSDLGRDGAGAAAGDAGAGLRRPAGDGHRLRLDRARGDGGESRGGRLRDEADPSEARSEEHTSELQSRETLVCRLLLEKTKPHAPTR